MKTQIEQFTSGIQKHAWIDSANRIVSFNKIREATCYTAIELEFWSHIMELVNIGYRLQ